MFWFWVTRQYHLFLEIKTSKLPNVRFANPWVVYKSTLVLREQLRTLGSAGRAEPFKLIDNFSFPTNVFLRPSQQLQLQGDAFASDVTGFFGDVERFVGDVERLVRRGGFSETWRGLSETWTGLCDSFLLMNKCTLHNMKHSKIIKHHQTSNDYIQSQRVTPNKRC